MDVATDDYHLSFGSLCIDSGDGVAPSLPSEDFEGDDRVLGATVDIGADEYVREIKFVPAILLLLLGDSDNCTFISNDNQFDIDNDGVGDACDDFPNDPNYSIDNDDDGLPDEWEQYLFYDLDEVGSGDPDGDGLINSGEYVSGTNPGNPDSDNDSLSDGVEVNILSTDPALTDTDGNGTPDIDEDSDGDGFTNAEEVQCDSDPGNPSSKCRRGLPWLMLLLE